MTTLEQAIQEYMERRSYRAISGDRITGASVRGLLTGEISKDKNGNERKPNPYALMQQDGISAYLRMDVGSQDVAEILPLAIRESVKSYTNKKPKVVRIYQDFILFLEKEYGVHVTLTYPYLYSNEFDRQMFIVKALHEKDRGEDYLGDRLWTGAKTIREDLADLESGSVSILGQKVRIDGIHKGDGIISFESTVHPIFLTATVEQVIALLEGLRHMSKDPSFIGHVMPLVGNIWRELSDYGKKRVLELIDSLSLEREWYEQLPHLEDNGLYRTEVQCSSDIGVGNVLDFLKNRKTCSVTYKEMGKEYEIPDVRIVDLDDDHIIARKDGKLYRILKDSITLTTYRK